MKFIINRQELYNYLWHGEQVRPVAKKYSMTSTNLRVICRFLKIPIPSDSTRFNIKKNKPYKVKLLSSNMNIPKELEVEVIKDGLKIIVDYVDKDKKEEVLSFIAEEERANLIDKISFLVSQMEKKHDRRRVVS